MMKLGSGKVSGPTYHIYIYIEREREGGEREGEEKKYCYVTVKI